MKLSNMLMNPSAKVLLFIHKKGEVRYTDLTGLISSRGTLSKSLKELEEDGLAKRRVEATKPIRSYYSLTKKGKEIAAKLDEVNIILGVRT